MRISRMVIAFMLTCMSIGTVAMANTAADLDGLRLFMDEDERKRLNRQRSGTEKVIVPKVTKRTKPVLPPRQVELPKVKLQGFITRSDGKSTVWINGRAVPEGQTVGEQLKLIDIDDQDGEVRIKMPNQSTIDLKPGQRFEPNKKKIIGPLE